MTALSNELQKVTAGFQMREKSLGGMGGILNRAPVK